MFDFEALGDLPRICLLLSYNLMPFVREFTLYDLNPFEFKIRFMA